MNVPSRKSRLLLFCVATSFLVHFFTWFLIARFRPHNFVAPVTMPTIVEATLTELPKAPDQQKQLRSSRVPPPSEISAKPRPVPPPLSAETELAEEDAILKQKSVQATPTTIQPLAKSDPQQSAVIQPNTALNQVSRPENFLASRYEKLTYQISMYGVPVGSAELEAENNNGTVHISLRVESNSVISGFYPVQNHVESRHVEGKFIMARVQQQEGTFRNEESFSINLGRKRVTWTNHLTGCTKQISVPTDQVLDTLSGIYLLRNRSLLSNTTEFLHIFDSDVYADVPVEIGTSEELLLPGLIKVDTLKLTPRQLTAGIFRRTGDITIWLTNDSRKIPVKIVTTVPLGEISAELISAETK